ncbi:alpha-L-rhamnosidase N-terminal domain-containing protein, partial [Paenibacillus agaridevorans]|uniref:alpha-L-rhamnosidase N-terminal domain-containing protein n=1 Tax=Paenibacillus agaridevorans TaxID=171404 RepID=UPI0015E826F0
WSGRKPWLGPGTSTELQPAPYLRQTFAVPSAVRRAVVYVTALGLFRLKVNGKEAGHLFAPGWTDYDKRVQVHAYEITELLKQGENVFGVMLGDGWYAGTVGFLGSRV